MSDNVIDLTARREQREALKAEKRRVGLEAFAAQEDFVAEFSVGATIDIIEAAQECGYDIRSNPVAIRDVMCLIESISGLLVRTKSDKAVFHEVTDNIFNWNIERCEKVMDEFIEDNDLFT